ncbi:MAG: NADH-quinone oxidoreductase subunit C [Desulfovermiculus sp.]|nr:NADH-quinone oxidoreductase subunit C [Desulfovermiculus sp.]
MSSQEPKKGENSGSQKKSGKDKKSSGPEYTGYDLDYFLEPRDVMNAVRKLDEAGYFLEDISCLDMSEGFQVVYHFDRYHRPGRVVLRVMVDRSDPRIPSIFTVYPGAAWHERECFDFFGIRFSRHPNLLPLLLDPEHAGPPPLLKDEEARKSLDELYPNRDHTPISSKNQEFMRQILDCSNLKRRTQT